MLDLNLAQISTLNSQRHLSVANFYSPGQCHILKANIRRIIQAELDAISRDMFNNQFEFGKPNFEKIFH